MRRQRARVALSCTGPAGQKCAGRATILGRAAAGGKKKVTLARASYALEIGTGVAKLKLTKQGRLAIEKRKSVTVKVVLVPRSGARVTKRVRLVRR